MQGDYTRAELLAQEAAGILARFEDVLSLAVVLLLLASTATMRSQPRRAARLFGAADELMERTGVAVFAVYRDFIDRCRAAVHEQLGDDLFEVLRQEGRASSADELITIAAGTG